MKRIVIRIISVAVVAVLVLGGLRVCRYLVTDDASSYTRIMMHQLYESEENIDALFVGSSHVYRSLIPEVADGIMGEYTFNAGTSSQAMDGSYALIKEAIAYNDVSHIYLEVAFDVACAKPYKERTEMTATYIISDYMHHSWNRMTYLLQASSKEYYTNSFIIARRNWEGLFHFREMRDLLQAKQQPTYKNYEYEQAEGAEEYYVDRGFVANSGVLTKEDAIAAENQEAISIDDISADYLQSLQNIVTLCEKKHIGLTLFIAPWAECTIEGIGNYDEYSEYMRELAKNFGVEYYDFNLCSAEYFDTADLSFFKDEKHLNTTGAEKFTEIFSEFFTHEITEEDLFYKSFAEKMAAEPSGI